MYIHCTLGIYTLELVLESIIKVTIPIYNNNNNNNNDDDDDDDDDDDNNNTRMFI